MQNGQVIDVKAIKPEPMTLNAVHAEYAKFSPAEVEARAKAKLQEYITSGQRQALIALRRIETEVPQDRVVPINRISFEDGGPALVMKLAGDDKAFGLHRHALGQAASRLGFPMKLMNELRARGAWGAQLAAHNLTELASHAPGDKILVRAVHGQARGILSASYKTDDSRPALDALLNVCREVGAVVTYADALDTRVSVKVMVGEPVEIFPGEWCVVGLDYRTSDYGNGAREMMGWVLRLLCINGAVVTTSFRKVHLGGRIQDEVEYSTRTRKLNEQFTASATRDMAKALLGPAAVEKMVVQVRAAHAADLKVDEALALLKKSVSKEDQKLIVDKYNSPDVELLPPGNTAWRFSNAISWLAGQVEDADKKLDLQALAGSVIEDAQKAA